MKAHLAKIAIEPPVFEIAIRQRVTKSQAATPGSKEPKRDNVFSQSRDTRENRALRQMKNTKSPQTFPHAR
jgi:hypothetical protein